MSRRVNLIPMAGAGQRFVDAGFSTAKPLIEVGGKPMIVRAADSLPSCDQWIFVCRREVCNDPDVKGLFAQCFSPFEVIPVDSLTEGQACTCLLAREQLQDDDMLNIGACDNAMTWSQDSYDLLADDPAVDAWIWTFRNNPAVLQNPNMYGWVDVDDSNWVKRISVKIPISETPMQDHAVIGSFTFRRASDFMRCADAMIDADRRINNEFYVDELMNVAVESGLKVKVLEVDRYICWGTPQDLSVYQYWHGYFERMGLE